MKQAIEVENNTTKEITLYWSDMKIFRNKGRGDYIKLEDAEGRVCTHAPYCIVRSNSGVISSGHTYRKVG